VNSGPQQHGGLNWCKKLLLVVVWNIFIFHNIWDNPSHWRTPSFFKMFIAPPTSYCVLRLLDVVFIWYKHSFYGGFIGFFSNCRVGRWRRWFHPSLGLSRIVLVFHGLSYIQEMRLWWFNPGKKSATCVWVICELKYMGYGLQFQH